MYLYTGADPVDKVDPSGRFESVLPPGLIALPSAAAVAAAAHQVAVTVLIAGITVFAAYEITEAIDCRQKVSQCLDKCTAAIVEEGGGFDASDIRRCVRKCLELRGVDCNY